MRKSTAHNQHFTFLRGQFSAYREEVKGKFSQKHPRAQRWLEKRALDIGTIRQQSQRLLTGATLSSVLLLSAPPAPAGLPESPQQRLAQVYLTTSGRLKTQLAGALKPLLPERIGHPDPENEIKITQAIANALGIKAVAELEGQRLNHSLGWIGYEQHLARFPGDSIRLHDEWPEAGMAPGLGAWGYLANSAGELTPKLEATEKYYAVVQTLYLPTWQKELRSLREWYKYRKVLIVNPETGAAVVAAIGDAGPAEWTGKQFGGSPEVMHHLGLAQGARKGKVLLLFVDDPAGQVPLGPVKTATLI